MAFPTFTPPFNPDYNSVKPTGVRFLDVSFGDGYSQRAGDGLNTKTTNPQLTWSALKLTQIDAIEAFFEARNGYEPFYYTLPDEGSARKFIIDKGNWTRTYLGPNQFRLQATFKEVFDIDGAETEDSIDGGSYEVDSFSPLTGTFDGGQYSEWPDNLLPESLNVDGGSYT